MAYIEWFGIAVFITWLFAMHRCGASVLGIKPHSVFAWILAVIFPASVIASGVGWLGPEVPMMAYAGILAVTLWLGYTIASVVCSLWFTRTAAMKKVYARCDELQMQGKNPCIVFSVWQYPTVIPFVPEGMHCGLLMFNDEEGLHTYQVARGAL